MTSGWRWANFPIPGAHVLLLVLGVTLNALLPLKTGWEGGWVVAAGILLTSAAVVLMIWATLAAGQVNLASPDQLVVAGPYAISRHPMYLAWTLLYVGVTAIFSAGWLLILLPILVVWIHFEAVREEKRMLDAFGDTYQEYQTRVRRYL